MNNPIYVPMDVSVDGVSVPMDVSVDGVSVPISLDYAVVVSGGGSFPSGGQQGDILIKRSSADNDAEWVPPASSAEKDNTRPITAAAVYTEIGNINALLATI